ncbi:MAG: hypothetical protein LBJ17_04080 [Dysgonamonadaceae bacterium]|jgi:uncharacterized protein YcbK (DUF882 family)|nr:hypothetical protein [Dysgonamonadaceae bacterium]
MTKQQIDWKQFNSIRLTKNFMLKEFAVTSANYGEVKEEQAAGCLEYQENLLHLCQFILQPLREYIGKVTVTSGYRNPVVNRIVGGSENSYHMRGMAADIITDENMSAFMYIKRWKLYTELILHKTFIHVALKPVIKGEKLSYSVLQDKTK